MQCHCGLIALELKTDVLRFELRIKLLKPSEHIGPTVSSNGVNPSTRSRFLWIKASGFLPYLQHHLLNQLIGVRR
jgi:hypothetical protein